MKKHLFFVSISLVIAHYCFSQAPAVEWQNNIGGNQNDQLIKVINTTDNGSLLVGNSYSSMSGDKTENGNGGMDFWVIKLNEIGEIEWQNTIGGNANDFPSNAVECSDGGFIIVGTSGSGISGDKTEGIIGAGIYDIWVVKLNSSGTLVWENTIGSNGVDIALAIVVGSDGGYLISATSDGEISGDKTIGTVGETEYADYWLIKIDEFGNIVWQKVIGGLHIEYECVLDKTDDGGYILAGGSLSDIGGDKTENTVSDVYPDAWIIKLDVNCNIIWQNTINAKSSDLVASIHQTEDGGYILGCSTNSDHGYDKSEDHYLGLNHNDFWVIKLNEVGNMIWQNNIGAIESDELGDVIETEDGGFLVGGFSEGYGGDKTEHIGGYDYWILKLNSGGVIQWQNSIGSSPGDFLKSIVQTSDNGYLLGGYTSGGISYDHTETNIGGYDYWVVKLFPDCTIEICNTLDDNCNGLIDDGVTETISISASGPTIFCQGGSVLLTATYSGTSVQWKKNGVNIAGAIASTYSVTKTGDYTCVTTSPCGTATSTLIHVTVNKNPVASITAGGATTFCAGGSVTLTEAAVAGSTYQWYKGASAIAGATSTNYIATTAGNYKCRVTKTASGCFKNSNTITVTVPCKEGGELNPDENSFSIYPNPNNGVFIVSVPSVSPWLFNSKLEVYSSLGEVVYSKELSTGSFGNSNDGNINETISIDKLSSGIYFVRFNNENNYAEQKLIIE
ncbi:MAG: T9SS type A sorting domain-containing protein [Chitinophagales bacterium]